MSKSKIVINIDNLEYWWRYFWDIPDHVTAGIEIMLPMVIAQMDKKPVPIAVVNGHKWRPEGKDEIRVVGDDFPPGHTLYPYRNVYVSNYFMESLAGSVATSVLASQGNQTAEDDPQNDLD